MSTKKTEKKPVKVEKKTVKIKTEKTNKTGKTVKTINTVKKNEESISPTPSDDKKGIIEQYKVKDGDTGSPEVQVALLSNRIEKLVGHLKGNPSDNHSRRGLLGIVSKRRRLLNYLEKKDEVRYKDIAKKLGLAK